MVDGSDDSFSETKGGGGAERDEVWFVERVRSGDPEAGHRFFREQYPAIYRYLLWLTGRPEAAEDLAQETFIRAWRHLGRFDGRGPLRAWLHRIAHREFLRSLRRQRPHACLEEVGEIGEPRTAELTNAVEWRAVIRKLPVEEAEVVVLHYLQGYSCEEVGEIVGAPAGTVKYRLSRARDHLQRELGGGDLGFLNDPAPGRRWAWLPLEEMTALEARLTMGGVGQRAAGGGQRDLLPQRPVGEEEPMERREFLRRSAAGAVGLALSEKEVVDGRLTRKVSLALKATALSDLCARLQRESGIHLAAGNSVADEKVTAFCQKRPLREIMRQLSRPFGYTWVRSGAAGEYRYELVQDLKSQLLEEELRNRDRHLALLALEREMERYRPYLGLTPEEARARAMTAAPEDAQLLDRLGRYGWGPIQMYFRLSPQQMTALHAGETLWFRPEPEPQFQALPQGLEAGILQCQPNHRLVRTANGGLDVRAVEDAPDGLPVTAVSDLRAQMSLLMPQREPGRFALAGQCGFFGGGISNWSPEGPWAVGIGGTVPQPNSARANGRLAGEPAFRARISVTPLPREVRIGDPPAPLQDSQPGSQAVTRVTSADVLEALHQATGMPVIADYYTRLHEPEAVSVRDQPLFEVLNRLTDALHLRWSREGDWLQFRSPSFFNDRVKEVPNRLLHRWAASRRQHRRLTLDDLTEISQLSDAQLDGADMAEGARELFGLGEWDLARDRRLRSHLRYLADFTPALRQEAASPNGLPFARMPLAQQQQFLALALGSDGPPLQSLDELALAVLRVDYIEPGWYEWHPPGPYWLRWVAPLERGRRVLRLPVRGRSRDATLQALAQVDPQIRESLQQAVERNDPGAIGSFSVPEARIVPTKLDLVIVYMPDAVNRRSVHIVWEISDSMWETW